MNNALSCRRLKPGRKVFFTFTANNLNLFAHRSLTLCQAPICDLPRVCQKKHTAAHLTATSELSAWLLRPCPSSLHLASHMHARLTTIEATPKESWKKFGFRKTPVHCASASLNRHEATVTNRPFYFGMSTFVTGLSRHSMHTCLSTGS